MYQQLSPINLFISSISAWTFASKLKYQISSIYNKNMSIDLLSNPWQHRRRKVYQRKENYSFPTISMQLIFPLLILSRLFCVHSAINPTEMMSLIFDDLFSSRSLNLFLPHYHQCLLAQDEIFPPQNLINFSRWSLLLFLSIRYLLSFFPKHVLSFEIFLFSKCSKSNFISTSQFFLVSHIS